MQRSNLDDLRDAFEATWSAYLDAWYHNTPNREQLFQAFTAAQTAYCAAQHRQEPRSWVVLKRRSGPAFEEVPA